MTMQKTLTELKRELELIKSSEIKFGFQCQEISNDIQLVIGKRISTQTIRRICGLLPYEGKLRGFTYGAIIEYIAKKKNKPIHLCLTQMSTQKKFSRYYKHFLRSSCIALRISHKKYI